MPVGNARLTPLSDRGFSGRCTISDRRGRGAPLLLRDAVLLGGDAPTTKSHLSLPKPNPPDRKSAPNLTSWVLSPAARLSLIPLVPVGLTPLGIGSRVISRRMKVGEEVETVT